jgi:acetolactate synthase-1/2/3 large subunit
LQSHLNYVGDVGLAAGPDLFAGVLDADLLVVVGARRGELTTAGYTLVDIPVPKQQLVHVHLGIEEPGRVYQPSIGINSAMAAFARAARALEPRARAPWTSDTTALRATKVKALESVGLTGGGADERGREMAERTGSRRYDCDQRRGQLFRVAAALFPVQGFSYAACAD